MSLPAQWTDRIFDKLTMTYGQAFLRRWQDIDINAVKSDWAHELAGFAQHPRSIAWALQNLPADKPPTVLEFRAIARKAPAEDVPRIEPSPAGLERIASEIARLTPTKEALKRGRVDHKAWAKAIIKNAANGIHSKSSLPLKMAHAAMAEKVRYTPVVDERKAA